jgi:dipeptidyl aminopeptidase/acylaminoacyl peptidase
MLAAAKLFCPGDKMKIEKAGTRGILTTVRLLSVLVSAVVLCTQASAQNRTFTVEQIFSAPFPSDLVAAPAHERFAWVFNLRGSRNIWIAEPSGGDSFKTRPVTSYKGDDGRDIGELSWDANGETVVYVRDGDLDGGGANPNPLSLPQGPLEQQLFAVSVSGGEPRALAEGHSPAVSPKGDLVAFIAKDQVWLTHLRGASKPELLIRERGNSSSLRWSPDGSRLAFVSQRGDHTLIGVYGIAEKSVLWLAPSVDRDVNPTWSPDGKQIAFIRVQAGARAGRARAGIPWAIWVADSITGKGHQCWKADEGPGSLFRGVESEDQLLWGAGDQIVFPWERTGWLQLYSVPVQGGAPKLLTPGDFEIFNAAFSPDRKEIIYSSNQNDIDRMHVWRVSVTGGEPVELTPGQGIEVFPAVSSDGKTVAVLASDARNPLHAAIVSESGRVRDLAPETIPADFPRSSLVVPQQVIFPAPDGLMIHGQLFLPPNSANGVRHPTVIFFHGGPTRQMFLGWHPMDAYHYMYGMNEYLASQGYVVLSVNYRGGTGYGLNFRTPENFGAAGASEFKDIQGAATFLGSRPDVDTKRVGLWGGSYGGFMTALGLARASDLFAAGVDYAGVHDWRTLQSNSAASGASPERLQVAWDSSPLASIKDWRSPVLVVQGDDDRNVPFSQTVELIQALRRQGVEFEQIVVPDEVHDSLLYHTWETFFEATADFFHRHLSASQNRTSTH